MRTIRNAGLLVVAGMLSWGLLSSAVQATDSPRHVVSARECWTKAMLVGDVDAVAKCYSTDAVMWLPGGGMITGRDAIRKGYADYFGAYTIKVAQLIDMGHVDATDATTSWGTFKIEMVSKTDGKTVIERGRYTDVSRNEHGQWMYTVDHASDDPAPATH